MQDIEEFDKLKSECANVDDRASAVFEGLMLAHEVIANRVIEFAGISLIGKPRNERREIIRGRIAVNQTCEIIQEDIQLFTDRQALVKVLLAKEPGEITPEIESKARQVISRIKERLQRVAPQTQGV